MGATGAEACTPVPKGVVGPELGRLCAKKNIEVERVRTGLQQGKNKAWSQGSGSSWEQVRVHPRWLWVFAVLPLCVWPPDLCVPIGGSQGLHAAAARQTSEISELWGSGGLSS